MERYKRELLLWQNDTELSPKRQGLKVWRRVTGERDQNAFKAQRSARGARELLFRTRLVTFTTRKTRLQNWRFHALTENGVIVLALSRVNGTGERPGHGQLQAERRVSPSGHAAARSPGEKPALQPEI